ncbi:MAG: MFS transporter, partial [Spirochaetaceae bacterium]|nr:MFS transporter [Spirochaetaceae bacterium]
MITFLLLVIIYLAFISLGLPDALLGVTLPALQQQWGIPMSFGGIISVIGIAGTVTSSFFSSLVIEKIGTGRVTLLSCLLTGAALMGISFAPGYIWILFLAFPLGLGAGAVDTALNNYVALHFKAHHMNWLHSFWGIGATLGPVIMSLNLKQPGGWRMGYRSISIFQISLAMVLLIS